MTAMAITHVDQFVFGKCPKPITSKRGLVAGGGITFPEVNFTLPPMHINASTWPQVLENYEEMITGVIERSIELECEDLLIEFETLPDMTINPKWGLEICRLLSDKLIAANQKYGQKNALRFTPNDIREFSRPPIMRSGKYWDAMLETFARAGEFGADFLSIESTGGKELNDEALVNADLPGVVFALGVLGCRDMEFLWKQMAVDCKKNGVIPAGDSACGFGNTAMVLADKHMIPKVFAAVVRAATIPRALVAVEQGAVGPYKDCAYEGIYLKAIAGIPIALEGKSAACAHFSPIGNIAMAVCDCWSNESVQNVQLLSGKAPVVSVEQLIYDCRLMNTAAKSSPADALRLRDWLVDSDAALDPQAWILRPDVAIRLSEKVMAVSGHYARTRAAVIAAIEELQVAFKNKQLKLSAREADWLDKLEMMVDDIPESEDEMIAQQVPLVDPVKCKLSEYGI